MELFNPKYLKYDFAKYFRLAGFISIALTIISLGAIVYPGLNYGIDFRGGIEASVRFKDTNVSQAALREALDAKLNNVSIVNFSEAGQTEFLVTAQSSDKASVSTILKTVLAEKFGAENDAWTLKKLDVVGPKVGSELRKSALLSLIYTCLLVTIYMYWRFDLRYSPGALACIFHDLILTAGFMALTRGEFDMTVMAAFLTLAGYSINDTVVVFDRIREIENKSKNRSRRDIVNEAINSTLSRTIMTAGTTLVSCIVLYFVGGPTLHQFSLALFFGIIVGTYSSAYIAAPLYIWADAYLSKRSADQAAHAKV
ncbi:MAG: protein translocase subunit SecF [Bdellovibrionales bacterium]|nr:protein translocase subunit SecF [Bdellovibrionales bacterium]